MWKVRSLCFKTDLFVAAFDGEVEDRGDFLVVRTPTNPDFWWGNFLLLREPPVAASFANGPDSWIARVARELPDAPVELISWDRPDGPRGEIEPALAQGFDLDEAFALTATSVKRP